MTGLSKISKILTWALSLLGAILFIIIMTNGDDAIVGSPDLQDTVVNPFIIFGYILTIVPALMMLVFSVWFFITHPKAGKRALMGLAGFAAVFLVGWLMADGSIIKGTEDMANETMSKLSGMSLYVFYIMGFATVGSILFSEVYKLVKK